MFCHSHYCVAAFSSLHGLDPAETRRVLESDEYTDAVEADVAQARMLGANGVPFFVIDRKYGISGAQKPPVFTQALETAWDESRKLTVLTGTGTDGTDDYPEGAVCGPEGCN